MKSFRTLKAEEIEVRVSTVSQNGLMLLLYKDARCDMNILDETVGPLNWKREHCRDNANCIVSIWDGEKQQWVSKEDTGTESFTEKEKGLASDSFKRACFNWGIGRELYTAPLIWIKAKDCKIEQKADKGKNKFTCYDKFAVSKIDYIDRKISNLEIRNQKTNAVVYRMWRQLPEPGEQPQMVGREQISCIRSELERTGVPEQTVCLRYQVTALEEMTMEQYERAMRALKRTEPMPPPAPPEMPLANIPEDDILPFK